MSCFQNYRVLAARNSARHTVQARLFSITRRLTAYFYTDKHEWVSVNNGKGTVGISHFAQDQLGQIVYVEVPDVGTKLEANDVAGCLKSVKAASEVFSPVGDTVDGSQQTAVNKPSLVTPRLLRTDQLGQIVYVEVPDVGTKLEANDVAGCLKSVKAASEVFSPVGDTVDGSQQTAVNKPSLVTPRLLRTDQLGQIVYVEVPDVGTKLEANDVAGCLKSVKAASEVFSPVGDTIDGSQQTAVNKPSLVTPRLLRTVNSSSSSS